MISHPRNSTWKYIEKGKKKSKTRKNLLYSLFIFYLIFNIYFLHVNFSIEFWRRCVFLTVYVKDSNITAYWNWFWNHWFKLHFHHRHVARYVGSESLVFVVVFVCLLHLNTLAKSNFVFYLSRRMSWSALRRKHSQITKKTNKEIIVAV